jgi:hypothetical protein
VRQENAGVARQNLLPLRETLTTQGLQDMKANPMGLTAYAVTASGAARV